MREARRELETIKEHLTPKQRNVAEIILEIPSGLVATYGKVASVYYRRHGHRVGAQMIAQTRKRLYRYLTHDTMVPLHRMACEDDLHSREDSPKTGCYNKVLRNREGTYDDNHDPWWKG